MTAFCSGFILSRVTGNFGNCTEDSKTTVSSPWLHAMNATPTNGYTFERLVLYVSPYRSVLADAIAAGNKTLSKFQSHPIFANLNLPRLTPYHAALVVLESVCITTEW
jgi:hypothetical protein